jgi:methionyl aminopeptidase
MIIHTDEADWNGMRAAGKLAAQCADYLTQFVVPGVATETLDNLAREFMLANNGIPACLGYKGYPKTLCISVNHVVCHGIPGAKILREGDIANIDYTVILDGWHGDHSRMYAVGSINAKAKKLIDVTRECLYLAIEQVKPGGFTGDIAKAIEDHAHKNGFSVVETFVGHGVGRVFHDDPQILHFMPHADYKGIPFVPGMFFTIEPMINIGKPDTKILSDGWTAVTKDKTLSAQWEHSIGVTETGYEIFTI